MACFSSRIDHLQRQCLALVGVHVACLSFLSAGGSFSSFGWERRLFCAEIAPKHGRSGSGSTKIPQERIGSFPFTTRRMHERLELEGFPRGFLTAFSKAQPRSFGSNLRPAALHGRFLTSGPRKSLHRHILAKIFPVPKSQWFYVFWKKYLGRKQYSKILLYLAIIVSCIYLFF